MKPFTKEEEVKILELKLALKHDTRLSQPIKKVKDLRDISKKIKPRQVDMLTSQNSCVRLFEDY